MACSKQTSLEAFLMKQPAADDADLNNEPEGKNV